MSKYNPRLVLLVWALCVCTLSAQWSNAASGQTVSLASVHFNGTDTGWACGAGGKIIRTTNGGVNWSEMSSGTTSQLNGIFFVNNSAGYVVGDRGRIFKSTDGGASWAALTSGTTQNLAGVYFFDVNTGVAVGEWARILRTTDGGASWQTQSVATMFDMLWSVKFADAQTGYAVGGSMANGSCRIVKTTDGGITWTVQNPPTSVWMRAVSCVDAQTCFAVGNDVMLKTTNGGAAWTAVTLPTADWYYSVAFAGTSTGWIGSDYGNVYKTTDGGSSWVLQYLGYNTRVNALSFSSRYNGWAACDGGHLFQYKSPAPALQITTQAGGGIYKPGADASLLWTSANIQSISIELSIDSAVTWQSVAANVPADSGGYIWSVPNSPSVKCCLRFSDASNAAVNRVTGIFTIAAPAYGDVDLNGSVQAYDAYEVLSSSSGGIQINREQFFNADVTADGNVTAYDASVILRYLVQEIPSLPYTISAVPDGRLRIGGVPAAAGNTCVVPVSIENGSPIFAFEGSMLLPEVAAGVHVQWSEAVSAFVKSYTVNGRLLRFSGMCAQAQNVSGDICSVEFTLPAEKAGQVIQLFNSRLNETKQPDDSVGVRVLTTVNGKNEQPNSNCLSNYPNPFNAASIIRYAVAEPGLVVIRIYDVTGNLISEPVHEWKAAGEYTHNFTASGLSSGFYICTLTSNGKTNSLKMLLTK